MKAEAVRDAAETVKAEAAAAVGVKVWGRVENAFARIAGSKSHIEGERPASK